MPKEKQLVFVFTLSQVTNHRKDPHVRHWKLQEKRRGEGEEDEEAEIERMRGTTAA